MTFNDLLIQYKSDTEIGHEDFDRISSWLSKYGQTRRNYFVPRFKIQDPSNPAHRIADLLGGAPFTSKDYPWPKTDGAGLNMQPIIQLNMALASENLGEDLGDGLLQLWARVDINREAVRCAGEDQSLLEIRLIPRSEFISCSTSEPPTYQPWRSLDCNKTDEDVQILFPDGAIEMKAGSIVEWENAGYMYANPACIDIDIGDSYRLYEQVFDDVLDGVVSPSNSPSIYLGGHGGQAGGYEDPTGNNPLLFRMHDDFCFHIGVTYRRTSKNQLVFEPIFRYYLR